VGGRLDEATMGWLSARLGAGAGVLVLPGAYDAYSALLAERVGFEAVYCSGLRQRRV
jgi:2-methylisocitrate lyase-like PEP mutase family enzyme